MFVPNYFEFGLAVLKKILKFIYIDKKGKKVRP